MSDVWPVESRTLYMCGLINEQKDARSDTGGKKSQLRSDFSNVRNC